MSLGNAQQGNGSLSSNRSTRERSMTTYGYTHTHTKRTLSQASLLCPHKTVLLLSAITEANTKNSHHSRTPCNNTAKTFITSSEIQPAHWNVNTLTPPGPVCFFATGFTTRLPLRPRAKEVELGLPPEQPRVHTTHIHNVHAHAHTHRRTNLHVQHAQDGSERLQISSPM